MLLNDFELTMEEVLRYAEAGSSTLVDQTVHRYAAGSEETNVTIIAAISTSGTSSARR